MTIAQPGSSSAAIEAQMRRLSASGERLSRWRRDDTSGRDFAR